MNLKRLIATAAVTGGLGVAALGIGAGIANAQPWAPGPPGPGWVQPPGGPGSGWQDRDGFDRAVRDHRPFEYQGRWVNPVFDAGHQG